MKKYFLFVCMVILNAPSTAQYSWTARNNFPGPARAGGSAFAINNTGYYGAGIDYTGMQSNVFKDFWSYDAINDTWTSISDIPVQRYSPMEFVLGDYGYVGTGWTYLGGGQTSDFYRYNPSTNSWTTVAPLPGTGRYTGIALSNGINGFGGFGYAPLRNDFYQYQDVTNSWTATSPFPSNMRQSLMGFSIGSDVYVGAGYSSYNHQDFWKYDPNSGTWSQISDYPQPMYAGISFTLNNKGIVGLGTNQVSFFTSMYAYDPSLNSWSQLPNFPSSGRSSADVFVVGDCAYVMGGLTASGVFMNDVWQLCYNTTGLDDHSQYLSESCSIQGMQQSISVSFSMSNTKQLSFELFDVRGRLIYSSRHLPGEHLTLPAKGGMYFYHISDSEGAEKTGKVLVY